MNGARVNTRRMSGFTLTEIAIVMVILGLVVVAAIPVTSGIFAAQRKNDTLNKLAGVETAMVNFVAQNRRLPCPADGALASGNVNAGVEARNIGTGDCTPVNSGVVPWVTLGLPEIAAQDGWTNRLTYRVTTGATGLTRALSLDLSACDPAGTGDFTNSVAASPATVCLQRPPCAANAALSCTSPTNYLKGAGRGLQIQNAAGTILMDPGTGTGAAYVVISAGDNTAGAYSASGALLAGTAPVGTQEATNRNGQALQAFYFDTVQIYSTTPGTNYFDDLVLRPSIMAVAAKAQLGPRGF